MLGPNVFAKNPIPGNIPSSANFCKILGAPTSDAMPLDMVEANIPAYLIKGEEKGERKGGEGLEKKGRKGKEGVQRKRTKKKKRVSII